MNNSLDERSKTGSRDSFTVAMPASTAANARGRAGSWSSSHSPAAECAERSEHGERGESEPPPPPAASADVTPLQGRRLLEVGEPVQPVNESQPEGRLLECEAALEAAQLQLGDTEREHGAAAAARAAAEQAVQLTVEPTAQQKKPAGAPFFCRVASATAGSAFRGRVQSLRGEMSGGRRASFSSFFKFVFFLHILFSF